MIQTAKKKKLGRYTIFTEEVQEWIYKTYINDKNEVYKRNYCKITRSVDYKYSGSYTKTISYFMQVYGVQNRYKIKRCLDNRIKQEKSRQPQPRE